MRLNRRDVLRYGAVGAVASSLPLTTAGSAGATEATRVPGTADLDRIVAAYRELQVGGGRLSAARDKALASLDEMALTYDASMNVDGDQLWTDLPSGPGSTYFPLMYYRLRTLAVAWGTPGSALAGHPDMPQRILTALETLYRTQYNENTGEIGNWYVYEIGVPYWLLQIIVALGDRLAPADRERYLRPVLRFVADPNLSATDGSPETGANRADKSLIALVSGALLGDQGRVATALAAVTDAAAGGANSLVARVTAGDGYHTDGSFIQHGVVPYPGHYGLVLLTAVAAMMYVTQDTGTGLAPEVRQDFFDTVTDVYAPFLTSGAMMEPVRGRMLSRQGETGQDAGHQFIAAVVLMARCAPEPTSSRFAGLAAQWIESGTWAPYLEVSDLARFSGGLQMVGVPEVEYAEALLAAGPRQPRSAAVHRTFPQSDRMVHVMEGWSASLGVGSTRTCRYEAINGMNQRGWYVGDGVLYTFLPGRQGDYSDAYWPTVDPSLLPGTTQKDTTPAGPANGTVMGATAFAGGVRFDERRGAQGLDFVSQDGTLSARKSWFFTQDAVLCLGAGITDASGARVRTTIENRNIGENGTAALLLDGRPAPAGPGRSAVIAHADWLHLDGVAGYVLLDGSDREPVTLLREDRTGTWLDIDTGANTHGTDVPYTRRYQKIVLDHGTGPSGASYGYAVLPGASVSKTRAARGRWRVAANTVQVQAVRPDRETFAAVFFAAAAVDGLTASGPAAVVWGRTPVGWTLAVSDPTQTGGTVRVAVPSSVRHVVRADPAVTVVATGARLVVDVRVAGTLGATHTVTMR